MVQGAVRTSVDLLRCLLLLGACAVLGVGLGGEAGLGAVLVEVAVVVHGLLERVALPAEDVITVGGGATGLRSQQLSFCEDTE